MLGVMGQGMRGMMHQAPFGIPSGMAGSCLDVDDAMGAGNRMDGRRDNRDMICLDR